MSMVERVACTIHCDGQEDQWEAMSPVLRATAIADARRAIAAMRAPTEAMRAAAMAATGSDSALSPVTADGRCGIFTAMIDAALGDEK